MAKVCSDYIECLLLILLGDALCLLWFLLFGTAYFCVVLLCIGLCDIVVVYTVCPGFDLYHISSQNTPVAKGFLRIKHWKESASSTVSSLFRAFVYRFLVFLWYSLVAIILSPAIVFCVFYLGGAAELAT